MLRAILFAAAVLTGPVVHAHATCHNTSCCAPHGLHTSSTGCSFTNCSGWGGPFDEGPWSFNRDINCPPGSAAANAQGCGDLWFRGGASVDENHNVSNGGSCQP